MTVGRIIETDACVAEGADWLAQREPRFADALAQTGPLPLRRRPDGYEALLGAIVSQQLSVAAADSIWKKLQSAELVTAQNLLSASEDDLRACGLSRPKIKYAKGLADSGVNFAALRELSDKEVVAELVKINGIGKWTAEIYALASLGRADIFASGDLALQEAAKVLFNMERRPTDKQIAQMALDWSPWRSVAARLLWAYYRVVKDREGIR